MTGDADCPDGMIRRLVFDAKDVKRKNFCTGNYTLGRDCVEFFRKYDGLAFFAFRLNNGRDTRLNSFLVAPVTDVLSKCELVDKGEQYLCSLAEIKEKCPRWWILEKDF